MPRYIDAEDFERRLEHPPYTIYNGEMFAEWYDECMKSQPTADVQEVRHGRWILDKEGTELVCSVCGGFAPLNYFKYHRVRSEYCPDCGARIDCKKEE